MPTPSTAPEFLSLVEKSGLVDKVTLERYLQELPAPPETPQGWAAALVRDRLLTQFQARQILNGRYRGFVLGPYTLLQGIGQGGMGVVYLAEHTTLKRKVAIKVLPQEKARDTLTLNRFYREARAAAALDHANIVRLHDISQGAGVHFLVMEYVDGVNLQHLLTTTGPMHLAQAVDYVCQAAAGLQHAHEKGFVHRDVKPGNLMRTKAGVVKILDMGLARSLDDPGDRLTQVGVEVAGTADYLAPEQALQQTTDARTDVYSLGVTLFTLLVGRTPFEGTTAQKLLQHQMKEPPRLSKLRTAVPAALSDVVARMVAKQPEDRYQSAEEVIDALRPWLPAEGPPQTVAGSPLTPGDMGAGQTIAGGKTVTRRTGKTRRRIAAEAWVRRNKWAAAAGAAAVLIACIGGVWAAVSGPKKPNQSAAAQTPPGGSPTTPPAGTGPLGLAAPPSEGALASFDAATVKPFHYAINKADSETQAGSPPVLPGGWQLEVWSKDAEGEFRAEPVAGRPALRVCAMRGTNAAQIVFRPYQVAGNRITPDRPYQVRIEYHLDPGMEGYVHFQAREGFSMISRVVLPNRGPNWQVTTATIQPGGKEFQIAIGCTRTDPGKFVSIGRIELFDPSQPVPANPGPSAAGPSGPSGLGDRPLFALDMSRVTPFNSTFRDGQHASADWQTRVPNGVYLFCWKKESVAEFRGVVADGRGAIGVTNLNDERSSQIVFQFDDGLKVPLRPGRQYRLRLEYRTTNEAEGKFYVRNPRGDDFSSIAEAQLTRTEGQWRTIEVTFRRPLDGKIDAILDNTTVGEGNTLYFRSLEVYEVG
jgi:tRNA A-37 threonylcarbamoyl transferase component Bud32